MNESGPDDFTRRADEIRASLGEVERALEAVTGLETVSDVERLVLRRDSLTFMLEAHARETARRKEASAARLHTRMARQADEGRKAERAAQQRDSDLTMFVRYGEEIELMESAVSFTSKRGLQKRAEDYLHLLRVRGREHDADELGRLIFSTGGPKAFAEHLHAEADALRGLHGFTDEETAARAAWLRTERVRLNDLIQRKLIPGSAWIPVGLVD